MAAGLLAAVLGLAEAATPAGPDAASPAPAASDENASDDVTIDPLGPNAACYVCHMTFVPEELAKVHLKAKVTCIDCHGTSAGHANDENIGATKPDITYQRDQIDASCLKCHETHDAPARKVIAQWQQLGSPRASPVCTECHGTHKIEAVVSGEG